MGNDDTKRCERCGRPQYRSGDDEREMTSCIADSPWAECIEYAQDVCDAVAAAREQGAREERERIIRIAERDRDGWREVCNFGYAAGIAHLLDKLKGPTNG